MFRYQKSNNKQLNRPRKAIAKHCPFNEEKKFTDDGFSLEDDETDGGLFFECKMCKGAQCTGYLRK